MFMKFADKSVYLDFLWKKPEISTNVTSEHAPLTLFMFPTSSPQPKGVQRHKGLALPNIM